MHLVPFRENWTGSQTKLDLKAIYRRPDPSGITLTGPLPLRRHSDWAGRGLQYVCLATLEDLALVAPYLQAEGIDPNESRDCFDRNRNFDVPKYLREAGKAFDEFKSNLQSKIDKHGAETVHEMMRMTDPHFEFPEGLELDGSKKSGRRGGGEKDEIKGDKK